MMASWIREVEVGRNGGFQSPEDLLKSWTRNVQEKEASGMTPRFGAQATGRMELSFTEIEESVGKEERKEIKNSVAYVTSEMPVTPEWAVILNDNFAG